MNDPKAHHTDSVASRLEEVRLTIPDGVRLVAVSKFHPIEAIAEAYSAGQRLFGESRATEVTAKAASLPSDIEWHFIGHLQTNKVKQVVACCRMIQSVDSERLLSAIDREASRTGKRTDVLLQVHVAREETKFGFDPDELISYAPKLVAQLSDMTVVRGVMGMASNTDDMQRVADDFRRIRQTFDTLAATIFAGHTEFDTVSMGMSHDRNTAIAQGSTMVRVGTDIFGIRE